MVESGWVEWGLEGIDLLELVLGKGGCLSVYRLHATTISSQGMSRPRTFTLSLILRESTSAPHRPWRNPSHPHDRRNDTCSMLHEIFNPSR